MSERARRLGLAERLETEALVESAFEPLRRRRASVGPTRVRAAVRWGRVGPVRPVPWVARVSELAMAVGLSVVVFAGLLTPAPVDESLEPVSVYEATVLDDILIRRSVSAGEAPSPQPAGLLYVYPMDDHLDPSRPLPAWILPQPVGGRALVAFVTR